MGWVDTFYQSHADAHAKADHGLDLLAQIRDAVQPDDDPNPTTRIHRRLMGQTVGAGTVDVDLGTTPAGVVTELTRFAAKGTANTIIEVYLDSPGDGVLVEVFTLNAQGSYADAVGNNFYSRENRRMFARFYTQAANQLCQIWAQVELTQHIPHDLA